MGHICFFYAKRPSKFMGSWFWRSVKYYIPALNSLDSVETQALWELSLASWLHFTEKKLK